MRLLREIAAESAAENKELLKGMVCGPGCALTPVCMYSRDKIGRMGYRIFFDCPYCLKAGIHCPVGFHRSTCLGNKRLVTTIITCKVPLTFTYLYQNICIRSCSGGLPHWYL